MLKLSSPKYSSHRAVHRYLEPEADDQEDDGGLDQSHQDGRQRLADQDLHGPERRDQQLVEGALLALAPPPTARPAAGSAACSARRSGRASGSSAIPGWGCTRRAVPRPRRGLGAMPRVEVGHDGRQVAAGDAGGRGMRPSRMTCSGARCPAASLSWKSAGMLITISALPASIWLAIWSDEVSVAAREDAGAVQPRQQFGRCRATALVQHRVGRVVQVVGGAVAEQQRLHQRRREQDHAAGRLLDDGQQFLQDQRADLGQGCDEGQAWISPVSSSACAGSPRPAPARSRTGWPSCAGWWASRCRPGTAS